MEEMKQKVKDICELKDKLVCSVRDELSKGIQNVNTHEMGQVIDMIKDLAEAEKECWESVYYKSIVEAMEEEKEMYGGEGRMGYDNWRYASGRFAPTGHGHRSGFRPGETLDAPWMMAEGFGDDPWRNALGYSNGGTQSGSMNRGSHGDGRSSQSTMGNANRMGYSGTERGHRYDQYVKARMGYHESKDASHKEHMDASARDYVMDIADSVEEIWRDADPAMRKEIKNKFVALTGKMN